ncbi:MAG: hypothetical protein PUE70_10490 [Sodaliphilus pleomorphus]|nr:hypothetical protein [Sodaliphilus pleomorphus]
MKVLRKVQGEAGGDCGRIKYSMGEGVKRGKAYVWWPTIATAQPRQQPELLKAYKKE